MIMTAEQLVGLLVNAQQSVYRCMGINTTITRMIQHAIYNMP